MRLQIGVEDSRQQIWHQALTAWPFHHHKKCQRNCTRRELSAMATARSRPTVSLNLNYRQGVRDNYMKGFGQPNSRSEHVNVYARAAPAHA